MKFINKNKSFFSLSLSFLLTSSCFSHVSDINSVDIDVNKTASALFNEADLSSSVAKFEREVLKQETAAKRVCVIDGGGLRGIYTAAVLSLLEMKTGKSVHDMFDAFIGTSTGGLIAMMLAKGMSATQVLNVYLDNGNRIFDKGLAAYDPTGFATVIKSLLGPKYGVKGLEAVMRENIGAMNMDEFGRNGMKHVAVVTQDAESKDVIILSSISAQKNPLNVSNMPAVKAARATSAAPTYFEGVSVASKESKMKITEKNTKRFKKGKEPHSLSTAQKDRVFIDGGLISNTPLEEADTFARSLWGNDAKIQLFSFGTGESPLIVPNKKGGLLTFGAPGNLVENGMQNASNKAIKGAYNKVKRGHLDRFERLNVNLPYAIDLADVKSSDILMKMAFETSETSEFKALKEEMITKW